MPTKSDYPAGPVEACRAVMAELWAALATYDEYMVLIGGWAPYFLLERHSRTDPGHIGSLDVDLALDAGRIPEVAYQTILDILEKRGYRQRRDRLGRPIPFSYLRSVETAEGATVDVQVDFLAPEYGGTGKSRRHQVVQDLLARKVRGANLVFDHFEVETLEARLPNRAVVDVTLKVADAAACLVMKGIALAQRLQEKDAYDLYLLAKHYRDGPTSLAEEVAALGRNRLVREALAGIRKRFGRVDGAGPTAVADFMEITDPDERELVMRDAFEVMNTLLEKLG
ncbi:MAG: nucleotidyl transferase AbiEii/AbiGii toxin family protein [Anaerolineae bacterium]